MNDNINTIWKKDRKSVQPAVKSATKAFSKLGSYKHGQSIKTLKDKDIDFKKYIMKRFPRTNDDTLRQEYVKRINKNGYEGIADMMILEADADEVKKKTTENLIQKFLVVDKLKKVIKKKRSQLRKIDKRINELKNKVEVEKIHEKISKGYSSIETRSVEDISSPDESVESLEFELAKLTEIKDKVEKELAVVEHEKDLLSVTHKEFEKIWNPEEPRNN